MLKTAGTTTLERVFSRARNPFFSSFFFVFLLEKTVLNLNYDCDLKESDIGD